MLTFAASVNSNSSCGKNETCTKYTGVINSEMYNKHPLA